MRRLSNVLLVSALLFSVQGSAKACHPENSSVQPDERGFINLERKNGQTDKLYWAKLEAIKSPTRGTLFYLAGGPTSHYLYLTLAQKFQRASFPDYDVVLYDYHGFNCSGSVQDMGPLIANPDLFTIPGMARDFFTLKRQLIGSEKVVLMGGSHGGMLGAEIVSQYSEEIDRAILFGASPQTGWFKNGWFRFDQVLGQMAKATPEFGADLDSLLNLAEAGELVVSFDEVQLPIDRATLEVAIWILYSQSVAAQQSLKPLVSEALRGDTKWIANAVLALASVAAPTPLEPSPTLSSSVISFHRCNIWFPASMRESTRNQGRFLNYKSFKDYWSGVCAKYDELGEYPQFSAPPAPTSVPLLVWTGDLDYFDPDKTQDQFALISSKVEFHLIEGWSHDFGLNAEAGIERISKVITNFMPTQVEKPIAEMSGEEHP